MEQLTKSRCKRCKKYKDRNEFIKNSRMLKTCVVCREYFREKARENRCPHGRQASNCRVCDGVGICEHNRRRVQCKECDGSQRCKHKKLKSKCIKCGGCEMCEHKKLKLECKICTDPIKVTINKWVYNSRKSDRKYNRYDANNFIDKCFLNGLVEDYQNCYYPDCKIKLQYRKYKYNLATIERLDNSIGHIKSNCVICCLKCNLKKKSNHLKTDVGGASVS